MAMPWVSDYSFSVPYYEGCSFQETQNDQTCTVDLPQNPSLS